MATQSLPDQGLAPPGKFADLEKTDELARLTGLTPAVFHHLGVGWDATGQRWSIPERDNLQHVVGIGYRSQSDGRKSSHPGGHRGLIIPANFGELAGPIYLPEGMSDTAAMLTCGVCALGRPMATTPMWVKHWLTDLLLRHGGGRNRPVVVIGDRDDAGVAGARKLVEKLSYSLAVAIHITCRGNDHVPDKNTIDLAYPVRWALPRRPFKDVRAQYLACGEVTPVIQEQ